MKQMHTDIEPPLLTPFLHLFLPSFLPPSLLSFLVTSPLYHLVQVGFRNQIILE